MGKGRQRFNRSNDSHSNSMTETEGNGREDRTIFSNSINQSSTPSNGIINETRQPVGMESLQTNDLYPNASYYDPNNSISVKQERNDSLIVPHQESSTPFRPHLNEVNENLRRELIHLKKEMENLKKIEGNRHEDPRVSQTREKVSAAPRPGDASVRLPPLAVPAQGAQGGGPAIPVTMEGAMAQMMSLNAASYEKMAHTFEKIMNNMSDEKRKPKLRYPEIWKGVEGNSSEYFLEEFQEWNKTQHLNGRQVILSLKRMIDPTTWISIANSMVNKDDPEEAYEIMRNRWSDKKSIEINQREFARRLQQDNESLETYMDILIDKRLKGWPNEKPDWKTNQTVLGAIVQKFRDGLKDEDVRNQMIYRQRKPFMELSIEEALSESESAKRVVEDIKQIRRRQQRSTEQSSSNQNKCYTCNQIGHFSRNCPKKTESTEKNIKAITEQGEECFEDCPQMEIGNQISSESNSDGSRYGDCVKAFERRNLDHITCNRCRQTGHYADKCLNERSVDEKYKETQPRASREPENALTESMKCLVGVITNLEKTLTMNLRGSLPQPEQRQVLEIRGNGEDSSYDDFSTSQSKN